MSYKSILDFKQPTIITAQQYGTKISVELDHSDTDLDEVMDAFQTLVTGLGYHDSAWKSWIVDRAAEYHEQDTEDLKAKLDAWKFEEDDTVDVVFHRNVKVKEQDIWDEDAANQRMDVIGQNGNTGLHYSESEIDEALAQHNAHEDGFEIDESEYDDYGQLVKPNKALKQAAKKYKKETKKTKKK
jgi:hypothetical protein